MLKEGWAVDFFSDSDHGGTHEVEDIVEDGEEYSLLLGA